MLNSRNSAKENNELIKRILKHYGGLTRDQLVSLSSLPRSTVRDALVRLGNNITETYEIYGVGRPRTIFHYEKVEKNE